MSHDIVLMVANTCTFMKLWHGVYTAHVPLGDPGFSSNVGLN
jgi:hypothetical protein